MKAELDEKSKIILIVLGVSVTYLYFGVLQEHIYKNTERDPFIYPELVVLCQFLMGYFISFIRKSYEVMKLLKIKPIAVLDQKILMKYSISMLSSIFFSHLSLIMLSFPLQALAKSCKIIPTFFGTLFENQVKYNKFQYFSVLFISSGVFLFNYHDSSISGSSAIGLLFISISLISDSLTAYFSEHIRHKFKPSSLQTFNNSCYCAIQIVAPVAVLVSLYNFLAEGRNCISYCLKFPLVINDILLLSLLSGFGQALVFWGISELGALAIIIITTLRKFTSIIISVAIFQHDFNATQWICIGFAFLGALFEIIGISLQSPHKIKP